MTDTRRADGVARVVVGVVAPYREVTHLTGEVGGMLLVPGAFAASLAGRRPVQLLARIDGVDETVGVASRWDDQPYGLSARFTIAPGPVGDEVLDDVHGGYRPVFEPSYTVVAKARGASGSVEVTEARLHAVRLVAVGTFERARAYVERTHDAASMVPAIFRERPPVDLTPLPSLR